MKKSFKKYLSLVMVLMVAFVCLFSVSVSAATEVARFEFGAYDSSKTNESSQDGTSASSYSETSGTYTLTLSSMSKVYKGSYDAKGNSCLKLGTSSAKGSFSFTVPADVVEVGILVAGYKAKTVSISINGGTAQTISTLSSKGEYTEVSVDTTTNKTVSFTTGTNYRCKIDAIVYYANGVSTTPSINIEGNNYIEVEDVITLTANTANITGDVVWTSSDTTVATVDQSGNVTAKAVGTTTITATADEVSDEIEFKVYPTDGSELTIAEAVELCEFTGEEVSPFVYTTTGVVESIDEAYTSTYGNITVTITDGNDSIKVFRAKNEDASLTANLTVGTKIKVTGNLVNYKGNTPEFNSGCTYVEVQDTDNITVLKEALNKVESYMSLAYRYSSTETTVAVQSMAEISFDDVANRTEYTTEKQVWEQNGITVTNDKASSTNNVGDYSAPARFYKSSTVTISADTDFSSVKITCNTAAYATALISSTWPEGCTVEAASDTVVVVTPAEKTNSITVSLGAQVRVDSLIVKFDQSEGDQVVTHYDSQFRLRCGVDLSLSEIDGVDLYGVKVSTSSKTKEYDESSEFWGEDTTSEQQCYYALIDLGNALENKENLDVEFTVTAFVEVEGVKYYSESSKTYSVASLVQYYYDELGIEEVKPLYDLLVEMGKIE